jgi:hypothetical protein
MWQFLKQDEEQLANFLPQLPGQPVPCLASGKKDEQKITAGTRARRAERFIARVVTPQNTSKQGELDL